MTWTERTRYQASWGAWYVRTENTIGSMILTIPRQLMRYDDFAVGQLFEIWREKHGSLELQNDTAYFLQDWQFYTDRGGREYIQLYATDANWLLDTAIVWAYAGSAQAEKTGKPDDILAYFGLTEQPAPEPTLEEKVDKLWDAHPELH